MVTLNGGLSQDIDNFTVFSTLGKSAVDSVVVQSNCFRKSNHFKVATILDSLDELGIPTDSSVPDHSLLVWESRIVANNRTNEHNEKSKSFQDQEDT